MCPEIKDLAALIACLESAVQEDAGGQYMLFGADLFPEALVLVHYIDPKAAYIRIDQIGQEPLVQPGLTDVHVVGRAALFNDVAYRVDITGTVPASKVVHLLMQASPLDAESWTFGANFPGLPDYEGYDYTELEIKPLPSFYYETVINPDPVTDAIFHVCTCSGGAQPQGLSIDGSLDATQGLIGQQVGKYIPGASSLPLSGSIEMRVDTFPLFDFTAEVPGLTIDPIGAASLNLTTTDVSMVGSVTIGSFPPFTVSGSVLRGDVSWALAVALADPKQYSLGNSLSALSEFVGGHPLTLPASLGAIASFYLESINVGLTPESGALPTVNMLGASVKSPEVWKLPLVGFSITEIGTSWQIVNPFAANWTLVGTLFGVIYLGEYAETTPRLQVQIDLSGFETQYVPSVIIEADLDPSYPLGFFQLFHYFTGLSIVDKELDLLVTSLSLQADTGQRTFFFAAALENQWHPLAPYFTFQTLIFQFEYSSNSWSAQLTATVTLSILRFEVQAAYSNANEGSSWRFSGSLMPAPEPLTVKDFLTYLSPRWEIIPDSVGNIALLGLDAWFDTGTLEFGFDTTVGWNYEIEGIALDAQAEFSINRVLTGPGGQLAYAGFVRGQLQVNALTVRVVYSFDVANNTAIMFQIEFRGIILTCTLKKNQKNQQILTVNLGGVTFGEILEYLVNLVDPNLGFTLSAPWNILNQISFDNLTLTVNLATKDVGISYRVNRDLGVVFIDTLGLAYVDKAGTKTVQIAITGRFVEKTYTDADPLSWDLLNDPAPAPSGQGEQLLDLRYLGVGQNVGFRQMRNFRTVQEVIDAMASDFLPANSQDQNPLLTPALSSLKFTGDDRWLIGADFTVMSAVSLAAVFNDPALYGLRVALAGEKVGKFTGLAFEILYRKVTDTIGVYHIELTLPDAMRQLQFGAAAVTLPIVVVDIYTNGNFRLDFGFPVNLDFSRSFCVQAGPFVGYGGFYFALLDGSTSERVPVILNGNFSPVIELGFALSVGMGRTIEKGILSAGATITLQAVMEGVFGWFNPNDQSASNALYYRIRGTAAIVGKVYGKVDFVIIKADVSIVAYAAVTLTIAAYQPIYVQLVVSVEVSVSLKVLFIRISFSFSTRLDLSFTVGSAGTAPWIVDGSKPQPLLLRQQNALSYRRLSGAVLQNAILSLVATDGSFDWTPRQVFPHIEFVGLLMIPALTVADSAKVMAHAKLPAAAAGPETQIVFGLFAPNSVPATARTAQAARAVASANAEQAPFNLLVTGMLRWALSSYNRDPGIPLPPPVVYVLPSDLESILEFLNTPGKWQETFTYDRLVGFLEKNYRLDISSPLGPSGTATPQAFGAAPDDTEISSTVFPMIPDLQMAPEGGATAQFWNYGCIRPDWEAALDEYYKQLSISTGLPQETGPRGRATAASKFRSTDGPAGCAPGSESISTFLFRDYFAMIAKGSVNSAIEMLKAYPYKPTGASGPVGESLRSIADSFNGLEVEYRSQTGDTMGTIAARFGLSVSALRKGNSHLAATHESLSLAAGTPVVFATSVTPESIAGANPNYPLQAGLDMTVRGVLHQVTLGTGPAAPSQSLNDICFTYGVSGPASLFNWTESGQPNPNVNNTSLLAPGATMFIPGITFTAQSALDDYRDLTAAFFFVRNLGSASRDALPWYSYVQLYQQWIEDNNPSFDGPTWNVPIVALVTAPGQSGPAPEVIGATAYNPQFQLEPERAPDTPELAAGYFTMVQLAPEPYTDSFKQFATGVTKAGPLTWSIASFVRPVQSGDTFESIARQFGITVDTLANNNAKVTGLLQPLAVVAMPPLDHIIAPEETLSSVASMYDLSMDALAESVQENTGILQPFGPSSQPMQILDVPGRDTNQLIADLVAEGSYNETAGMVSRFLLHGMRAASTDTKEKIWPPNTPLWPLYELDGQQFPLSGLTGTGDVYFSKGATADWICFKPVVGQTDCTDVLVARISSEFIKDNAPAPVLDPQILWGPTGLPLFREEPPRYGLEQSIHWQSAVQVALPGPTGQLAGQPSIWRFPESLQDAAITSAPGPTASTPPYELVAAAPQNATGVEDRVLESYAWASFIDIRIQQAPAAAAGQRMPNSYVVLGADQAGRDQLLSAWNWVENSGSLQDRLYLLYAPSATSNNPQGFASDNLNPELTFLLKTNLSTVTHSNLFAKAFLAAGSYGAYYSRITSIAQFLKFLWEASITGTGGFYLNYVNAAGGQGLPAELFADGDTAIIRLLLLLDKQSNPKSPNRGLYPFNNCAVVGENLDASASNIYARLAKPKPDDLQRVPNVPAGHIGFDLSRRNPDFSTAEPVIPPEDRTRSLYNLLGFHVLPNDHFSESNEALPVGPVETPVPGVEGPTGPDVWKYSQVIPIYRFGETNDTPFSEALPNPEENPYRGITGPVSPMAGELSRASIDFAFHDVYGNVTAGARLPALSVPVGYTDPLVGLSSWPGLGADYAFLPGSGAPKLNIEISSQISRYVPAGEYLYDQSHEASLADADRYRQVFYQTQQDDLKFKIETNLGELVAMEDAVKAPLLAFVSKAKVYTDATAALLLEHTTTSAGELFGAVAERYSVTPGMLASANSDLQLKAVFQSGSLVRPFITAAAAMNTLNALVVNQSSMPYPPACGATKTARVSEFSQGASLRLVSRGDSGRPPVVSDAASPADPLTPAELAQHNSNAPLTPGITMRTLPRESSLPDNVKNTLVDVAAALQCQVYSFVIDPNSDPADPERIYVGLYQDNLTAPDVVAPDLTIRMGGIEYTTTLQSTLQDIQNAFASLDLSTGDFVVELEAVEGIFRQGAQLKHADFIIPQPPPPQGPLPASPVFSLVNMPEGAGDIAYLATTNRVVSNFYNPGTPIYLSYECYSLQPADTFSSLSQSFNLTVEQLGEYNSGSALLGDISLAMPNLVYLPDPSRQYAPYAPTASDSLDTIARIFALSVSSLAEINRYLPGIFEPGVAIQLGIIVDPKSLDSLQSVANAFDLPFASFITQISAMPGLYRRNGTVLTPLPKVPSNNSQSLSLNDVAATFNVRSQTGIVTTPLLDANRSLSHFLRHGATVRALQPVEPLTVGEWDTVDSIIRRFKRERDVDVTTADLADANGAVPDLLTSGQVFLLPANPTAVEFGVTPTIPPPGGDTCQQKILFPVTVGVRMTRSRALVSPDFAGTMAVYDALSSVAPRGWKQGADILTLDAFAEMFEAAFANDQLKCAISRKTASGADEQGQIWAFNFGASGVSSFKVQSAVPQFYALRPLSRELLTRDVLIRPYRSGCGFCAPVLKKFDSVDLDVWMAQFLATLDLFLETPYSVPAFQLSGAAVPQDAMTSPPSWPLPLASLSSDGPIGESARSGIAGAGSFLSRATAPGADGCQGCTGGTGINGPANYDSIVASKLIIAQSLREDVAPILQGAGPTFGYYAETARETLYQQMLIQLSNAYTINAIIQYPVDVKSPCLTPPPGSTAQAPPRLSGSVTPDLYVSPPGSGAGFQTLAGAAAEFFVAAPFLAQTIAEAAHVLLPGATVEFNSGSYTIRAGDTLNKVANSFGVPIDPYAPGYWDAWTLFIDVIALETILDPLAVIPVAPIRHQTAGVDTLASVAAYAGVSAPLLAEANQNLPGIVIPGTVITVAEYNPYVVSKGEKFVDIVAGINAQPLASQPPTVTVPNLAIQLRDTFPLLAPKLTLACVVPANSLSSAAFSFSVSVPHLARAVLNVQGLLLEGASVHYPPDPPYTVETNDSLRNVADHFNISPDNWDAWTAFLEVVGGQPIVDQRASFPVIKIAREVYPGNTLETMAVFADVDAAAVGEANQTLFKIFKAGETIAIPDHDPYVVQNNDTLLTIVRAINAQGNTPPVTVGSLSLQVATQPGLLVVGEELFTAGLLPEISLSTAKVSLGRLNDPRLSEPPLSVLFSLKHPRQHKNLFLNLKYVIKEAEYDVTNVSGVEGYQASSWLTFLLPIGSGRGIDGGVQANMDQVQIPIPLRSYPTPPTLAGQGGSATPQNIPPVTPEQAIAEGKQWDYTVDFQSNNAAQDNDYVDVIFNIHDGDNRNLAATSANTEKLFNALAEFTEAYPQLMADLSLLPKIPAGANNQVAAIAVMVLDECAAKVAAALSAPSLQAKTKTLASSDQWPEEPWLYRLRKVDRELYVGVESGPSGPLAPPDPLFPNVFVQSPTGPTSSPTLEFVPLKFIGASGMTARYEYPGDIPTDTALTQRFQFTQRDIIRNQNAWSGIYLTRNSGLIASGPLGTTETAGPVGMTGAIATSTEFLYQTPLVRFIDPLTPFLGDSNSIDIARLSGPTGPPPPQPRTLNQHIVNLLDTVLELGPDSPWRASANVSVLVRYGFDAARDISASIPVCFVPTRFLKPVEVPLFSETLAATIEAWRAANNPTGQAGRLIFDVSVFTPAIGATGTEPPLRPILEFEKLFVPMDKVIWSASD